MAGFLNNTQNTNNTISFLRRIRKFNTGGWDYMDNIVRKSRAIGKNEYFDRQKVNRLEEDDLTSLAYDIPGEYRKESIDATYNSLTDEYQKNEYLEEIGSYDEIDFVLTTIADESIIDNADGIFASPNLSKLRTTFSLKDTVLKKIEQTYNKLFFLFRFQDTNYAWRLFKEWLVVGKLAFEIIYNDTNKEIIGFRRLDPFSLQMQVSKIQNKYIKYWIQYKGDAKLERQLTDNEVIYITYNDSKNKRSYLESIIRSFNLLRTLEDTRALWGIMHSVLRMRMIVPISTKSAARTKVQVAELRNRYKEIIEIDKTSGEITYNGKTNLPLFKNYIFPSKDGEQIDIEPVVNSFNDVISTDELEYWSKKFKLNTKIPFSRFDSGDGGGSFNLDVSIENEEIRFSKFIGRLRNSFKEILLKPFKIQLKLDFPELKDDINLLNNINIVFNKDNIFEELKEIEIFSKRIDFINNMSEVVTKKWDKEEEDFVEEQFFSSNYLVEKYLKLSTDEILKNTEYKEKYKEFKPETTDDNDDDDDD